ncbi:MAG TPA: hypothetical protein VKC64_07550 [Burkholderiales bacterium]|nr:hypothetical protein [Burkholderiales bacterium]
MNDPQSRDPRLDEAYRQAARDEPPAELDERIRAAARRAVAARPQSLAARAAADRHLSWSTRWRVPLSIAATVLIAATLTLMVQEEERRPREEAPAPARTPATPADQIAAPPAEPEAARRDAPSPSEATSTTSVRQAPPAHPAEQRALTRPYAPASPPSLEKRREQAVEVGRDASPTAVPSVVHPPAAAAPPADGAASLAAPAASEAAQATPAPAAKVAPTPSPTTVEAKPAAPARAITPAAPTPDAANRLSQPLSRDRELGDRPARAMRESPLARSPEEWIAEIRRLKAQGREADAAAELAEFRRRYPDYALPTDLAR